MFVLIIIMHSYFTGVYRIKEEPDVYIDINGLVETHEHNISAQGVSLGASLSLTDMMAILKRASDLYPDEFFYCDTIADGIDQVANVSVRNVSTNFHLTILISITEPNSTFSFHNSFL